MGTISIDELQANVLAHQKKSIANYSEEQKATHKNMIEKQIVEKWELFVQNWLNSGADQTIVTETVKAHEQECLYMVQTKTEDGEKIKSHIMQVF